MRLQHSALATNRPVLAMEIPKKETMTSSTISPLVSFLFVPNARKPPRHWEGEPQHTTSRPVLLLCKICISRALRARARVSHTCTEKGLHRRLFLHVFGLLCLAAFLPIPRDTYCTSFNSVFHTSSRLILYARVRARLDLCTKQTHGFS